MAKQQSNGKQNDLPIPDDTPQAEAPGDAQAPKFSLADLRAVLSQATDDEKRSVAEQLGLSKALIGTPATKRRRRRPTEEDVKNMALATGGASHDDDFLPNPPEYVEELGPEAVKAWQNQWLDGKVKNWNVVGEEELQDMVESARL